MISQLLDDVVDGQVLTANICNKTFLQINEIDPVFPIEDLTGIQDFTSLEVLLDETSNCVSIDFGDLENLREFYVGLSNDLNAIDISGCNNLEILSLPHNSLNALDLSQNPNLKILAASNNNLTSFDARNGSNENIEFFFALTNPNL